MPTYKTPGVYVEEISVFPPSVAEVETAIPAFIGYTERATRIVHGDLKNVPTRIKSLLEFELYYGVGPKLVVTEVVIDDSNNFVRSEIQSSHYLYDSLRLFFDNGGGNCYIVSVGTYNTAIDREQLKDGIDVLRKVDEPTILLFPDAATLSADDLAAVQQRALLQCGTLRDRVAILDLKASDRLGVSFRDKVGINNLKYGAAYTPWLRVNYGKNIQYRGVKNVIKQGAKPVTLDKLTTDEGLLKLITAAEAALTAAGDPAAAATKATTAATTAETKKTEADTAMEVAASKPVDVALEAVDVATKAEDAATKAAAAKAVDATAKAQAAVTAQAQADAAPGDAAKADAATAAKTAATDAKTAATAAQATATNAKTALTTAQNALDDAKKAKEAFDKAKTAADTAQSAADDAKAAAAPDAIENSERALLSNFSIYANIINGINGTATACPPSGAIAGVYALIDGQRGVWKAPANVSINGVIEPDYYFDIADTDSLNLDSNAGKSINAILAFSGKGTLVWGARTLAGNDNEWRYVPVRRFFNMVEESIKKSTYWAVFEPNDANTWVKVRGMIENYLTQKWREGALAGATTKDAFFVRCGLGVTMNSQDILEGRMNVEIGMAVVRPAEFIILKFSHKLQTS